MPAPIVLTGVSGFIAKRIALDLLNAGHSVRGTLRSMERAGDVAAALRGALCDPAALDRLSFCEVDLGRDAGWAAAMAGAGALVHTASPFPMGPRKTDTALIDTAVDGTLRALRAAAAAGVERVVLTSSVGAIEACDRPAGHLLTPQDWTDPAHPRADVYFRSKTLAERAAWDFAGAHPQMRLTTINPALVAGRPLDGRHGTSVRIVKRLLSGRDPLLPDVGFGIVDIEDVSAMHLAALMRPETAGKRYIAVGGSASIPEIAAHLKARYPERRITTRRAPAFVLRMIAPFDAGVRMAVPGLGVVPRFDCSASVEDLGVAFTPWQTAIERTAEALLEGVARPRQRRPRGVRGVFARPR